MECKMGDDVLYYVYVCRSIIQGTCNDNMS